MKYRLINPEVFATEITNENRSTWSTHSDRETVYPVGDFVVTHPDGNTEVIPRDYFLKKYKPSLPMNDVKRDMYRLCTEIIDQQSLVDEDNAEALLAHACDVAKELRKLF